jgi:large subunit ribosomal protein L32
MMRSLAFAVAALSATHIAAFAPRPSTALAPAAASSLSTAVAPRAAVVLMAVPKSRTSKKKTRQRKANWFAKANIQRERALTLGRSVLSEGEGSFIYNPDEEDDDEDDEYEDDDEEEEDDDEEDDEE